MERWRRDEIDSECNGTCLSGLYCDYRKICIKPTALPSPLSSSTAL
jgi:hypothetical protein